MLSLNVLRKFNRPFISSEGLKEGRERAMTLIEIIIVVALLGTLMTILVKNITGQAENARVDQTKIQMGNLSQSLQLYRVHNGRYPTTEQGLKALLTQPEGATKWRGPYTEENKLKDAFDNDFDYTSDGRTYKITSAGKDGTMGTSDDIFYPEDAGDSKGATTGGAAAPE